MLGFGEILLALIGFAVIIAFLLGTVLASWKVVHNFRRQHRLEAEADERSHRKQMADDYSESLKLMDGTLGTMSYQDYSATTIKDPMENLLKNK